jgi:C1A family cysteine protease
MVIAVPAIPAALSADNPPDPQSAPLNPAFEHYVQNMEKIASGDRAIAREYSYGYRPPTVDLSHMESARDLNDSRMRGDVEIYSALPAAFNWTAPTNYVTSVKNQNPCGTCWTFGNTNVIESKVWIDGLAANQDFSEQALNCCTDPCWTALAADRCDKGASDFIAQDTFIKKGARQETCQPYNTGVINTQACSTCTPAYMTTNFVWVAWDDTTMAARNAIKTAIQTYGPVTVTYYHNDSYLSGDKYYYTGTNDTNHLVSIVGWDDTVSHPAGGGLGAWKTKNSWGTSFGDGGYFWLCYGKSRATQIGSLMGVKAYDSAEQLYYWDEAGWVGDCGYNTATAWMANIFTASPAGNLTHVDFYATDSNEQYDIRVYKSGNINSLGSAATTQTGTCSNAPGYYSIPLSTPVALSNGQAFTVVVKMTTTDWGYPLSYEKVTTGCNPPIQTGKSYMSYNGSVWEDLAISTLHGNFCLRVRVNSVPLSSITVTYPNGSETWAADSNQAITWTSGGGSGNVDISLSRDGGLTYTAIISNTANDGTQSWAVSTPATVQARIKVSSASDALVFDTSNADFAITAPPGPHIDVTSPNGGQTWGTGHSENITWTSDNISGDVKIMLSRNGGATYTTIVPSTPIAARANAWTVAAPLTATALIKVASVSNPAVFDVSNDNFTIAAPPTAPTLATPASGAVVSTLIPMLDWNNSPGDNITYGVQVSTASTFATATLKVDRTGLGASTYNVATGDNLTWNTTYYWRANAANAAGDSSWSTSRTFKTGPGPAPDAPYGLSTAPVSSTQINLAWNDNSANEVGFKVERKKAGTTTYALVATVGENVTTYSNTTGLTANTTYTYRVRAYNFTSNYSAYSNEASATTLPLPPAAPTLLSPAVGATTDNLTPRLDWNNSLGDNITYGVQVSTASSFAADNLTVNVSGGLPTSDYTVTGDNLTWNTTYYWRANATNLYHSTSRWSVARTFKTAWGHPRPTNLIATENSSTRIDLAWSDNSTGETGFKIERKKLGGAWAQVATVGTDNHTYSNSTGLTANTQYFYRVRAYLGTTLNSAYSDNASATTAPLAPTLVTPASNATNQSVTPILDWSDTAGAVSYRVQVSAEPTFASTVVSETGLLSSNYPVPAGKLNPGIQYYWRVNATNSSLSTSAWSLVRSFTTAGP